MITDVEPHPPGINPTIPPAPTGLLPPGAEVQHIAFVAERTADQPLLLSLPAPVQRHAVEVNSEYSALSLLTVPAIPASANTNGAESEYLAKMRLWVEAAGPSTPAMVMTFQGAQLCCSPGRAAILAPADRLPALRAALIEFSFYEGELRDIERTVGAAWPQLETDTPLAFEFEERSISKRKQLRQRFQQMLLLRARLARIGPYAHSPHLHPPTLASQIAERLRDRTRLTHRHESLSEQIEVFERIYEMCSQRASDFMLARGGHMLEWIIIVLLLAQLALSGFEYLTSIENVSEPAPATASGQ